MCFPSSFWDVGFLPSADGLNSGLQAADILFIFFMAGFDFLYVITNQLQPCNDGPHLW